MEISGDEIAEVVLREFEKWPKKCKPIVRSEWVKEWVPMSGIVAHGFSSENDDAEHEANFLSRKKYWYSYLLGSSVSAFIYCNVRFYTKMCLGLE